jgi:hypothetical protein
MRLADSGNAARRKQILRKKRGSDKAIPAVPQQEKRIDDPPHRTAPPVHPPEQQMQRRDPVRKTDWVELKPEPEPSGNSNPPVVQSPKELENYALTRADGICELCDTPAKEGEDRLTVCYFIDPFEGKSRTSKEVAALCPDCFDRVQSQHLSRDIKILKRKARRKRISEVKISIR